MNDQQQCAGCFLDSSGKHVCPACGYDESASRSPTLLPLHTRLAGHYTTGRELSPPGSFGITYLGWDQNRQKRVAIKEYLPRELATREAGSLDVVVRSEDNREAFDQGEAQFMREAQILKQFDHPNIVQVHAFFSEHGTAYLVTEFYDGMNLDAYLTQVCPTIDAATSVGLLKPILDGLQYAHERGLVHRDINPRNVYLAAIGRVILIDFGSVRQALRDSIQSLSAVLAPSYAPLEQYQKDAQQSATTDVYGVAATLYRAITGQVPPLALDRLAGDPLEEGGYAPLPPVLQPVLQKALALTPEDRYGSAREFLRALEACDPAQLVPPPAVVEAVAEAVPAASAEITLTPQEPAAPAIAAPVIVASAIDAVAPANRSTDSPPQGKAAGAGETIELSSKPRPLPSTRQQRRHDDVPEDAAAASRYVIVEEQPAKPPVMTPQRMRLVGIGAAVVLVIALGGLVVKPSHHASTTPASAKPATNDAPADAPTPAAPAVAHRATDESTDIPVPVMSALPGTAGIKPFRIGQTEITVAQFRQFVQREGYVNPRWTNSPCESVDAPQASWEQPGYPQTGDFPVVCVSRTDARAYAAWLGRATGNAYRLPTEAEWDYANRAASTPNPDGKTPEPVRSHPANELGLFDTAGNVREWTCSAAGGADAARSCASMSDGGPSVIRGGSWHDSDHRAIQDPDHRDSWTGFRLAQDIK